MNGFVILFVAYFVMGFFLAKHDADSWKKDVFIRIVLLWPIYVICILLDTLLSNKR